MDNKTHRSLQLLIGGVAALGGLVAVLGYFENKRDRQLKAEVMSIDKHIKLLELDHRLHQVSKA